MIRDKQKGFKKKYKLEQNSFLQVVHKKRMLLLQVWGLSLGSVSRPAPLYLMCKISNVAGYQDSTQDLNHLVLYKPIGVF